MLIAGMDITTLIMWALVGVGALSGALHGGAN